MAPHPKLSTADAKELNELARKKIAEFGEILLFLGQTFYVAFGDNSVSGGPVYEHCSDISLLQMMQAVTSPVPIAVNGKENNGNVNMGPNPAWSLMQQKNNGERDMFKGDGDARISGRERAMKAVYKTLVSVLGTKKKKAVMGEKLVRIEEALVAMHANGQYRLTKGMLNYLTSARSALTDKNIPAFGINITDAAQRDTLPHHYPSDEQSSLFKRYILKQKKNANVTQGAGGKFVRKTVS